MRFVAQRISIVVVALYGAVCVQSAGLKYLLSIVVLDDHMQPRAPRWVRRRQFMTSQILYQYLQLKAAGSRVDVLDGEPGRL